MAASSLAPSNRRAFAAGYRARSPLQKTAAPDFCQARGRPGVIPDNSPAEKGLSRRRASGRVPRFTPHALDGPNPTRDSGRLRAYLCALRGADRALRLRQEVRAPERRRAGLLLDRERGADRLPARVAGARQTAPPA